MGMIWDTSSLQRCYIHVRVEGVVVVSYLSASDIKQLSSDHACKECGQQGRYGPTCRAGATQGDGLMLVRRYSIRVVVVGSCTRDVD